VIYQLRKARKSRRALRTVANHVDLCSFQAKRAAFASRLAAAVAAKKKIQMYLKPKICSSSRAFYAVNKRTGQAVSPL
jgi:hypothetical protein